ncbi:MAG: nucleoside deaminase [Chromatiales bacterium]|jgi:tRNA(Arg) A34 adenosine deaminase TadA
MNRQDERFMQTALSLARQGITQGHGGPFGAVVVCEGEIVGRGWNQVILQQDPTAHAEILAIRDACRRLGRFHLEDAILYSTCEPCPMCLSAAYWARIPTLVYAADARDAAAIGFDDRRIKQFLQQPLSKGKIQVRRTLQQEALAIFRQWQQDPEKVLY